MITEVLLIIIGLIIVIIISWVTWNIDDGWWEE